MVSLNFIIIGIEIGNYATTGKAAIVNGGSTLHSYEHGIGLPITCHRYTPLSPNSLKKAQERLKHLKLIFIDEYSMLSANQLCYVDRRLRQILCKPNVPFGGVAVVLSGDPGQLPPVAADPLWDKGNDKGIKSYGYQQYMNFESVIGLTENRRINKDDPTSAYFEEFLLTLRDAEVTEEDYNYIRHKCSRYSMGPKGNGLIEWNERGFERHDAVHLYQTNVEVQSHNNKIVQKLCQPIALINGVHTGKGRSMSPDYFRGLKPSMFACVGAKMILTHNIGLSSGLCNGSIGKIVDIVYEEGDSTPSLPKCIIVDFPSYKGEPFFQGEGCEKWVPVYPQTLSCKTDDGKKELTHSRTMFPLQLSYAMTVWKAQGQTYDVPIVVRLPKNEPAQGYTYVIFSRARRLEQIGLINGITLERLTSTIAKTKGVQTRKDEEKQLAGLERNLVEKMEGLGYKTDIDLALDPSVNKRTVPVPPAPSYNVPIKKAATPSISQKLSFHQVICFWCSF